MPINTVDSTICDISMVCVGGPYFFTDTDYMRIVWLFYWKWIHCTVTQVFPRFYCYYMPINPLDSTIYHIWMACVGGPYFFTGTQYSRIMWIFDLKWIRCMVTQVFTRFYCYYIPINPLDSTICHISMACVGGPYFFTGTQYRGIVGICYLKWIRGMVTQVFTRFVGTKFPLKQ